MEHPDEPALIEEIRLYGTASVSPDAIDLWFERSGWPLPEVSWAVALGACLIALITADPHDQSLLPVISATGVVIALGLALAIWRSIGQAPALHIGSATLRAGGVELPLEDITVLSADGCRLTIASAGVQVRLRLPDAGAAAPLIALIEHSARQRRAMLLAGGHDVDQPARVPPELLAIRQR